MNSMKLRLYAYALNIPAEQRDSLVEFGDQLTTIFSESRDQEKVAQFVMAQASNADEAKFICHAFDVALARRFKSPYRARAVIYTWLLLRCREITTCGSGLQLRTVALQMRRKLSKRFRRWNPHTQNQYRTLGYCRHREMQFGMR